MQTQRDQKSKGRTTREKQKQRPCPSDKHHCGPCQRCVNRTKGKRKTENKQGKLDPDAITGWELTEKEEWLLNSDNVLLLGQVDKLS